MFIARPARLMIASALSGLLAATLAAHALSSSTAAAAPDFALAMFPSNGHAIEKLAYNRFQSGVQSVRDADARRGAPEANNDASGTTMELNQSNLRSIAKPLLYDLRRALRHEPLMPRAYAILALGQDDPQRRVELVTYASKLSKRTPLLQGLVLELKIAERSYAGTIATIDEILRVSPSRSDIFYPVLTKALASAETVPVFINLMRDPLPWRASFLEFAVADPSVRLNLAKLRQSVDPSSDRIDQSLIAGLVDQGELKVAADLYAFLVQTPSGNASKREKLWPARYPPLDWKLTADADLRAQPTIDGKALEIFVRPGNGGILAERLIVTPTAPFRLSVKDAIVPQGEAKNFKIRLACVGKRDLFLDMALTDFSDEFEITSVPAKCQYSILTIAARSWSGMSPIRGTISSIKIDQQNE